MKKKEWIFLGVSLLSWRLALQVLLVISPSFWVLNETFLGGGTTYLSNPGFWAWGNFDGEHYLAIAQGGYLPLTYFYFPLYPMMASIVASLFGHSQIVIMFSLLLVSHISFAIGIIGYYKLAKLEFNQKVAALSVVALLLFPTSFYFAAAYTESLYFALSVWAFYFMRKKRWIVAGLVSGTTTAVRIVGIALYGALLVNLRKFTIRKLLALFISIYGIVLYTLYVWEATGNPLEFVSSVGIFGDQRSSSLVLLPQVFYRYIFKILPVVEYSYFPVFFTTWLEFGVAMFFLALLVWGYFQLKKDIWFYSLIAYIIPTLSGSFSSFPRYVLAAFPLFFLIGFFLSKKSRIFVTIYFGISVAVTVIASTMFFRGLWVS